METKDGTTPPTDAELLESLTGYEELAIEEAFGKTLDVLAAGSNTMLNRALIFVDLRRGGAKVAEARKQAMELPVKTVLERFAADEDELMPDEPVGESGKGDEPPA